MNNGISSAPTHTRILQQCRVPYVRKQVSQTAQPGSLMSWGLCWVVRKWGRAENTSCSIQLTSFSSVELSQYQKEWQHFVFYSLSQRTTLNIRCHLVKVIWTIQHHPFHEWISAPVLVTVHKSTTWACGFFILRQMLLIDNDGIWGSLHCCSHDAAMGKAMENDRLVGKKDSSPKLATDLFLYYLTIIYKGWQLGGGAKLACK